MKKPLLLLAALAATVGVLADEWQQPVYSGSFQPLTVGDTVYIYNPEAKLFLTEGNDWGTHATVGASGLLFTVQQYVPENGEWDGETYNIYDYTVVKDGWRKMFITDGGHVYMDNASQEDNMWKFVALGDNTYQIVGADSNPVWISSGDFSAYKLGRYTEYINGDGDETGTGVIYDEAIEDNYLAGTFQTTWAFVSQADYAAYGLQVATYEAAIALGKQIAEDEAMGVTGLDEEKAVFANTGSTLEEIQAASISAEQKVLAYYEVNVTPETPVNILTDDCSSTDGWVNGAGAATFDTGSWAGDNWEGFVNGDTYINIWDGSLSGAIYCEREGLPNGIYVVTISAQAESAPGAVFANENRKTVPADKTGHIYKITTEVTDGYLQFGYVQDDAATNWVTLDNVSVDYYGQGTEAYRFWLNSLLESAPSFDDVIAMDSLVEAYNAVLASVNTAETKDEILAIIPAYEDILDKIALNIAAYEGLIAVGQAADEMATADGINLYYGDKLSDFTAETLAPIAEEHTLGTEAVNAVTAQLQTLIDEAQQYLWNRESLTSEVGTAQGIYEEYKDQCSQEAADAYQDWTEKYTETDFDEYTADDVKALLEELYAIEFNLQVPVDPASDTNPIDYTAKVQYPSFDGGATGWTNDGWATCGLNSWDFGDGEVFDAQYLNLWNPSNARVYQTVQNLPAGAYILQISAYVEVEGFQVYANDDYLDVKVGQNENGAPFIYSNTADAEPYDATIWRGNIYRIATVVGEDGTLEIGARNTNGGECWGVLDNVKLTYYGSGSAIVTEMAEVSTSAKKGISAIYTLSGTKVSALQKGINIIKMQDGAVRKVLVK